MGLGELLDKIRDYYLDRLVAEANAIPQERGLIIEPAYRDDNGEIVTEGFFDCGTRVDLVVTEEGKVIETINVDTEDMLSFSEITFEWGSSLSVTLSPFQWNYCPIVISGKEIDWNQIMSWFEKWFEEKPSETTSFMSCVHFISDPKKTSGGHVIDIDFGTSPVEALEELLDSAIKAGANEVHLGGT